MSSKRRRWSLSFTILVGLVLLSLDPLFSSNESSIRLCVRAADDDAYYADDAAGDDAAGDDAAAGDDEAAGDDGADEEGDDNAQAVQNYGDDDMFQLGENGFNSVTVMPVSCINYNNGHMIKFDFYENTNGGTQCHFNHLGYFVVSIAHYMRAYFNNEAILNGQDFRLPGDAGYLNCVMLQETEYSETKLYAKIGCMDRETFTSTKLQLHVYTDAQCSVAYDDGKTAKKHSTRGYEINGYYFSTRVSFRPPFYSCMSCVPDSISETYNKKNGNWYDDDYIAEHGKKEYNDDGDGGGGDDYYADDYFYANDDVGRDDDARYYINNGDDAAAAAGDDAAAAGDDAAAAGDDAAAAGDDAAAAAADDAYQKYNYDDDYYSDDDGRRQLLPVAGQLEAFEAEFWNQVDSIRRSLGNNNYYDIGDWNMCQRINKYGLWCDEDCRALDAFRVDEWSKADIFLLVIMCVFMAAMMLLVVAKRLKASQKARVYGDENYKPGLPPLAMAMIFVLILGIIVALAKYKFVNETLVFAVVTCILLFIYMLKLTLFESRRPVLLAAPRHDLMESPLDDRFF